MKTCQKFAQVKLRRGPDSVINIFSTRDKCTFVVLIMTTRLLCEEI